VSVRRASAVRLSVSLVLLGALLWRTDRAALARTLAGLDPLLFASAAGCFLAAQGLSTIRWQRLLRAEGIPLPFASLFALYLEGMFLSLLLPTLIGGDLVRAHRVYVQADRNEAAIASILVERLSGLVALLAIAWGSLAVYRDPVSALPVLGFSAALALGWFAMFSRITTSVARRLFGHPVLARVHREVTAFYHAVARYRHRRGVLVQVFGLSLIIQAIVILANFLVARALGLSAPFVLFLALIPLATITAMMPISVGGLGVRDGAMVYLFTRAGLPVAGALGLSLGWFFVTAVSSLPGALVLAFRSSRKVHPGAQGAGG
jgi:uncharacterized protein (TIRG00374 family)